MLVTETTASNVRAELARKDMTQSQAALKLGISKQAMSSKLNNKTTFTLLELGQLAQILDVDIRDFFQVKQAVADAA
ncbi:helix-turn-helix transcriptional regulator [Rothia sp. SD9660Na]|uniref:helix-turn-helix transcriptional regulator n=1 Tax=Rothia sp. SD9660Na TaxID=3047030 RepID=UPI0024BAE9C4|nr:helix-turn-helix transcriptional regulator [Rothia sp. SD9660Na]WHS51412.1 helix-turn-helix transcriptional regulator [Rothia sp. SD9660Na]